MKQLKPSELVLDNGKVYHLDLAPHQISETIILVGDQFRVAKVSAFFDRIEHQVQKREFVCHTGYFRGKRLSVVSTGIGTDNVDIVLNELDALVNFDLEERREKSQKTSLTLVRIGTCGVLREEIRPGTYLLSTGSVGLDNLAHFYELPQTQKEVAFLSALNNHLGSEIEMLPYFTFADQKLNELLQMHDNVIQGITVTASGFYGPQGRELRLPLRKKNFIDTLASFEFEGHSIVNLEMESSAIFALSQGLGHRAATICVALANRVTGEFLADYETAMDGLMRYVLNSITSE